MFSTPSWADLSLRPGIPQGQDMIPNMRHLAYDERVLGVVSSFVSDTLSAPLEPSRFRGLMRTFLHVTLNDFVSAKPMENWEYHMYSIRPFFLLRLAGLRRRLKSPDRFRPESIRRMTEAAAAGEEILRTMPLSGNLFRYAPSDDTLT